MKDHWRKEQFRLRRRRVMEYATYLGMDVSGPDKGLLWLAEQGIDAPLPEVGRPCFA